MKSKDLMPETVWIMQRILHDEKIQSITATNADPTSLARDGLDWITNALAGGKNHRCWGCAYGKVMWGVMIPFLADVLAKHEGKLSASAGGRAVVLVGSNNVAFIIKKLALYCHTGTSHKLHANLTIAMHTVDDVPVEHSWSFKILKPSFSQRNKPDSVFPPDIRRILDNDIYPETTRDILFTLMSHLHVGSSKIQQTAISVMNKLESYNTGLRKEFGF
ncbi:MAG: hypothetical protein AAB618_01975 [Patescibacteria group bacterium]